MLLGLLAAGCRREAQQSTQEQITAAKPYPVRVIVVDDAPLADVLERQWKARIENELTLTQMTLDQLESARQLNADAVIYPSACLGTLAERELIAAPSSEVLRDAQYAGQEVFDLQRHVEVRWGTSVLAFSFGSPQLTLMYRADLLEALGAEPPAEWPELEQLAQGLTREQLGGLAPAEDLPWSPLAQPLSAPWGAHVLLRARRPMPRTRASSRRCSTTPRWSR
jgi:hypothetical protein